MNNEEGFRSDRQRERAERFRSSVAEKLEAVQRDLDEAGFARRDICATYSLGKEGLVIEKKGESNVFLSSGEIKDVVFGIRELEPEERVAFDAWYEMSGFRLGVERMVILDQIPNKEIADPVPDYTEELTDPVQRELARGLEATGYKSLGKTENLNRKEFEILTAGKDMGAATPDQITALEESLKESEDPEATRNRNIAQLAYQYQIEDDDERTEELIGIMRKHDLGFRFD